MSEVFDCGICFDRFDEDNGRPPKILPACGHTFCLECLLSVARTDPTCPKCRSNFPRDVPSLNNNFQILEGLREHNSKVAEGSITGSSVSTRGASSSNQVASDSNFARLHVSRLPPGATEQKLKVLFSRCGTVKDVEIIRNPKKNYPGLFGFVSFSDQASVEKALREKHSFVYEDGNSKSKLHVNKARRSKHHQEEIGEEEYPASHMIFVPNLPVSVSKEHLNRGFSQYGAIDILEVIQKGERNQRKSFAFVTFADRESVQRALVDRILTIHTTALSQGIKVPFRKYKTPKSSGSTASPAFPQTEAPAVQRFTRAQSQTPVAPAAPTRPARQKSFRSTDSSTTNRLSQPASTVTSGSQSGLSSLSSVRTHTRPTPPITSTMPRPLTTSAAAAAATRMSTSTASSSSSSLVTARSSAPAIIRLSTTPSTSRLSTAASVTTQSTSSWSSQRESAYRPTFVPSAPPATAINPPPLYPPSLFTPSRNRQFGSAPSLNTNRNTSKAKKPCILL